MHEKDVWAELKSSSSSSSKPKQTKSTRTEQFTDILSSLGVNNRYAFSLAGAIIQKLGNKCVDEILEHSDPVTKLQEQAAKVHLVLIPDAMRQKQAVRKPTATSEQFAANIEKLTVPPSAFFQSEQDASDDLIETDLLFIPFANLRKNCKGVTICSLENAKPFLDLGTSFFH